LPPVDGLRISARLTGDVFELDQIEGSWQGAALTGRGRLPLHVLGDLLPADYRGSLSRAEPSATASIQVASVTPESFSAFIAPDTLTRFDGRIDVDADVRAEAFEVDRVTADVTFATAEVALAGIPIRQAVPTKLHLSNGRLAVDQWRWEGPAGRLDARGSIQLGEGPPSLGVDVGGFARPAHAWRLRARCRARGASGDRPAGTRDDRGPRSDRATGRVERERARSRSTDRNH
jgi:hypothetical protein